MDLPDGVTLCSQMQAHIVQYHVLLTSSICLHFSIAVCAQFFLLIQL